MTSTPKRRWFSFSLRTAFVLLTLACLVAGWVAYELNWIRQRHEVLERVHSGKIAFTPLTFSKPTSAVRAPGLLWIFGEEAVGQFVLYGDNAASEETERLRSLFPEATFVFDGGIGVQGRIMPLE